MPSEVERSGIATKCDCESAARGLLANTQCQCVRKPQLGVPVSYHTSFSAERRDRLMMTTVTRFCWFGRCHSIEIRYPARSIFLREALSAIHEPLHPHPEALTGIAAGLSPRLRRCLAVGREMFPRARLIGAQPRSSNSAEDA